MPLMATCAKNREDLLFKKKINKSRVRYLNEYNQLHVANSYEASEFIFKMEQILETLENQATSSQTPK